MSWGKIDDHLDDDGRLLDLDLAAKGLWLACLPRCLRAESPSIPRTLAEREGGALTAVLAAMLVERGLWLVTEGGWEYANGGFAGWDAIVEPAAIRQALHDKRSAAGRASVAARVAKYGTSIPPNARNALQHQAQRLGGHVRAATSIRTGGGRFGHQPAGPAEHQLAGQIDGAQHGALISSNGPAERPSPPNTLTSATEHLPNATEPVPVPVPVQDRREKHVGRGSEKRNLGRAEKKAVELQRRLSGALLAESRDIRSWLAAVAQP